MALINSVLSWLIKKRIHQIELFTKYPHEVQTEWFRKLMQSARDTEWGKKYDYRSITSPDQFRERVPLNTYETLKPYIDELRQGRQNILWPGEIKWFAKSSGTTSDKSKFIPVSQEALEECHFKGGKDMLSLYCNNFPNTALFDGRGLAMGGSHRISEINTASFYDGDLSAIIIQNLPSWAEFIRVPKKSTALMDNWEDKIEMMASETIPHNVTSLSGVPSWMILLLKRILKKTGKSDILQVWPNLEVYFHGGVNFQPYQEQFKQLIRSDQMNYMETYTASEGFFGLQDHFHSRELLLMLDYGIFYEFIPVNDLDQDHPRSYGLDEVDTETNYALVISTNGGLWRYLIGDTIRFTSLNPFRIQITGRTKNFINAVGEELIVDNAEKALTIACKKCHAIVNEFTAAPSFSQDGDKVTHEWLIEFETEPENLEYFRETLDNALKSLNSDYEAKRFRDMVLCPPVIRKMPKTTFYKWLKKKGKLGGQHKVPRLSNDRIYVEELLATLETKEQTKI
ncbi:MAG: GH3 auxin-responsive promoter family protein [Bacteroidales bacterium]|nr:GH3 auxin-responsive promoter family protein [Bacteroidales bacterium]